MSGSTVRTDNKSTSSQTRVSVVNRKNINIADAADGSAAPDALAAIGSGDNLIECRTFANDSTEEVVFAIPMVELADSIKKPDIKVRVNFYISNATPPTEGEGVSFNLKAVCLGNDDLLTDAFDASAEIDNVFESGVAQYQKITTDWATIPHIDDNDGDSLDYNHTILLYLARDHDDTVDDYAQKIAVQSIDIAW